MIIYHMMSHSTDRYCIVLVTQMLQKVTHTFSSLYSSLPSYHGSPCPNYELLNVTQVVYICGAFARGMFHVIPVSNYSCPTGVN